MLRPDLRSLDLIVSMAFTGDLFAPDAVYEDAVLPDHVGESYHGLDGFLRAARSWLEPFEWLIVELKEIIDADDCVVSLHRARMKMLHTEIEFESPHELQVFFEDLRQNSICETALQSSDRPRR